MNKLKIKKGDNVMVIAGKRGMVERVLPKENKVVVTGTNIAKHHLKPSKKNPHGGIIDKITPMDVSNIIIICPSCGKPVRAGYKITNNQKMRICRKCKEGLDTNG